MSKYTRLKKARLSVQSMIGELRRRQEIMRSNPVGVDTISDQGYDSLIQHLEYYKDEIDSSPPDFNVIWTIIGNHAKWFTAIQYKSIMEIADYIMM